MVACRNQSEAGMQFQCAQTDYGMQVVTVTAVEGDEVTVDMLIILLAEGSKI